jgi:hypothetical protein
MAVDCEIFLPFDACLHHVAETLGRLAGLRPEKPNDPPWKWGITVEERGCPGAVWIILRGDLVDGETEHSVMYSFQSHLPDPNHGRLLAPRSTAFWIAAGVRLVSFFGGALDCREDNASGFDLEFVRPRARNNPQDDPEYAELKTAIAQISPLTAAELHSAATHAYYSRSE